MSDIPSSPSRPFSKIKTSLFPGSAPASSPPGLSLKALLLAAGGLGLLALGGCSLDNQTHSPGTSATAATPQAQDEQLASQATGQLEVRANGEDFVRDGFTSKDGWAISFDHLYVGLAEVAALQTSPPFDPDNPDAPNIAVAAEQPQITVVDLASDGDSTALVAQFPKAQAGRYNALGWSILPATSGPSQGQSLRLVGQANKDAETIAFTLDWDNRYQYLCGDFIGDQRKGILKGGDRADLEATFHFDHVFGDGDAPPEDALNQDALGFGPLAALAENGSVTANRSDLQAQLSPADFQTLEAAIAGLAHVGEGHCRQEAIQ